MFWPESFRFILNEFGYVFEAVHLLPTLQGQRPSRLIRTDIDETCRSRFVTVALKFRKCISVCYLLEGNICPGVIVIEEYGCALVKDVVSYCFRSRVGAGPSLGSCNICINHITRHEVGIIIS